MGGGASPVPLRIIGVVASKPGMSGDRSGLMYRFDAGLSANVVRLKRDDVAGAVATIDALWARLAPAFAPDRRFVDDLFNEQYANVARISTALAVLAGFALTIATIGLFAFASLVAARRVREIGVRKTLGASNAQLVLLLWRGFLLPIVVGNLIAWPVGLVAARGYLARFAEPVAVTPLPFIACFLATLLVACCAIGGQTLRAARTVPADVLRSE
jgi:putative ABC transport system permease protein